MEKISKRQEAIMDFIKSEVKQKGYPPSVREIGAAVGLASSSTVHGHLARLSREDSEVYDEVKAALLRKCRLSTEAFRQRFRDARRGNESHPEFAYHVKVNLVEWLKSAQAYGNHDKVIECMVLEQFFRGIPEEVRLWVQDRLTELDVERAAELAEDYCTRRNFRSTPRRSERSDKAGFSAAKPEGNKSFRRNFKPETSNSPGTHQAKDGDAPKVAQETKAPADGARALEARKRVVCYNCGEKGHMARSCERQVVFATIQDSDKNLQL